MRSSYYRAGLGIHLVDVWMRFARSASLKTESSRFVAKKKKETRRASTLSLSLGPFPHAFLLPSLLLHKLTSPLPSSDLLLLPSLLSRS